MALTPALSAFGDSLAVWIDARVLPGGGGPAYQVPARPEQHWWPPDGAGPQRTAGDRESAARARPRRPGNAAVQNPGGDLRVRSDWPDGRDHALPGAEARAGGCRR